MKRILLPLSAALIITGSIAPQTESAAPIPPASTILLPPLFPDAGERLLFSVEDIAQAREARAQSSNSAPIMTALKAPAQPRSATTPAHLIIPSINLNNSVIPVGLNDKGEMAVPDGDTTDIGWYRFGTFPGDKGSAVMDAHVFAAFSDLSRLSIGDSIYVENAAGEKLRFIVRTLTTYKLADMGKTVRDFIFNRDDGRYLNLITCAGSLTEDKSTYTHRLVVHAELVR